MSSRGRHGQESRIAVFGGCTSIFFERITYITFYPYFVECSSGWSTPPFYSSAIHLTTVCSFLRITMMLYVLTLCSSESSLLAEVRYSSHVRSVSSTIILYRRTSHVSILLSILRQFTLDAVTFRDHLSITVCKMMNHSVFHIMFRTPHPKQFFIQVPEK